MDNTDRPCTSKATFWEQGDLADAMHPEKKEKSDAPLLGVCLSTGALFAEIDWDRAVVDGCTRTYMQGVG